MDNNFDLKFLRSCFDTEVSKAKLTDGTIRRYQSWIRRYLKYCSHHKIGISIESSISFLKTYEKYATRRQGFYALQFFMMKVMKQKDFIILENTAPTRMKESRSYLNYIFNR